MRILLVCLGNICRSPMAVGALRAHAARAGLSLHVEGAGTGGHHAGEPPDRRAVAAAARRGFDISALRARRAEAEDFRRFDLVYAMDRANLAALARLRGPEGAPLGLFLDEAGGAAGREVPDPYYDGRFEEALDLIEAAAAGLIARLARAG